MLIHCNFQQNVPLFCAISDFVVLLLIADASCLMAIQIIYLFFVQGLDIGREVTVDRVLGVNPMPSQPTRRFGGAS